MHQDYTVYTHFAEPLGALPQPGRRISAALLESAVPPNGKQSRCGGLSIESLTKPSGIRAMPQHQMLDAQQVSAARA
jgi:hypothetical protein